jgi:hypothetical protein
MSTRETLIFATTMIILILIGIDILSKLGINTYELDYRKQADYNRLAHDAICYRITVLHEFDNGSEKCKYPEPIQVLDCSKCTCLDGAQLK